MVKGCKTMVYDASVRKCDITVLLKDVFTQIYFNVAFSYLNMGIRTITLSHRTN